MQARRLNPPLLYSLGIFCCAIAARFSDAGSATWNLSPGDNQWNTAASWTPATVPNGPNDVATFGVSNQTNVQIVRTVEVNQIVFNAGASAFTITSDARPDPHAQLHITGTGIINNSGLNQTFVTQVQADVLGTGVISFFNQASAGSLTTIINSSGPSVFTFGGGTEFYDSSTAGDATIINEGSPAMGQSGFLNFHDNSSAGNSQIINHGGTDAVTGGGSISFADSATADHATVICNGGEADGASGGGISFNFNSTAGSANFTVNGGAGTDSFAGSVVFYDNSSLGSASFTINGGTASNAYGGAVNFFTDNALTSEVASFTVNGAGVSDARPGVLEISGHAHLGNDVIIANGGSAGGPGGQIILEQRADGGEAQFKLFGNSSLDTTGYDLAHLKTGSIEGEGTVLLGGETLILGANDLDAVFSGVIQGAGSLSKTGKGTLTLSGANLYAGGTALKGGKLFVNNTAGSGVGTGPLQVTRGTLGGKGTIAGMVTIGSGTGSKPLLAPGARAVGTLTIQGQLIFNSDAIYRFGLNSNKGTTAQVAAAGVTINSAQFSPADLGNSTLATGTTLIAINNTAPTPISGTFANLPDGGTITIGPNNFRASYEGGDGNDLTLTVL